MKNKKKLKKQLDKMIDETTVDILEKMASEMALFCYGTILLKEERECMLKEILGA